MRSRLPVVSLLVGALFGVSARAAAVPRVAVGSIVNVKVEPLAGGGLRARSVEPGDDDRPRARGPLSIWPPVAGRFSLGPLAFRVGDARLEDAEGREVTASALRPGDTVRVTLAEDGAGGFVVEEIRLRPGASTSVRLEGHVTLASAETLELLGWTLLVDDDTAWEGVAPPTALERAQRAASATRLTEGAWLSIKGEPVAGGVVLATTVGPAEEQERSVRGLLTAWAPAENRLAVGPIEARVDEASSLEAEDGTRLPAEAYKRGDYVKATLAAAPGGGLRVEKLKQRSGSSAKVRLEGPVESVTPTVTTEARFRVLGVEVVADPRTVWEGGLMAPRFVTDDEDARPVENISLGRAGTLSGEVRLDSRTEQNYDLAEGIPDDLGTLRLRADLEWTFPASRHVSGMLEVRGQAHWVLNDAGRNESDAVTEDVRLGETWVLFRDLAGGHAAIQVGRNRWDDARDWWYTVNLDSVRSFLDFSRVHFELSVGEQQVDPSRFLKDARYALLRAHFDLGRRHELSLIVLDRDDRDAARDFQPRWYGLHAEGRIRRWAEYWLDFALARGRVENERLSAYGWDAGVKWTLPGRWEPALTLASAFGSGDDVAGDGVSRTFRQTGLHDNNGKWAGVTSFRYYGEVLDPELANLEVHSIGFGVSPRDWWSVELAWHRYAQHRPNAALVDSAAGDHRRLNLVDTDVGTGWDVVIGWEQLDHWEVEVNAGVFQPGDAFLGPQDDAWRTAVKLKYVF